MSISINILTQMLLTLLTFIALPILRKQSVCRSWFCFGNVHLLQFKIQSHLKNRGL